MSPISYVSWRWGGGGVPDLDYAYYTGFLLSELNSNHINFDWFHTLQYTQGMEKSINLPPSPVFFFIKPSLPIYFRATYMDVVCIRLGVARGLFSTHLAISQTICHFNMHVHFSGLMRLKYIFLLIFLNFKKFRDKGSKNWRKKHKKEM